MVRKEKTLLLEEVKDQIDSATSLIVTKYEKLEPNAAWDLRSALKDKESQFEVVKKRVFVKAAESAGLKLDVSQLQGHIGIVLVKQDDAIGPAKVVFKFSKDNGDIFQVLYGKLDGKIVPGEEIEMLSKLPSLDEMRATMLALFTAPMSQLLSVMEAKVEAAPDKETE
jgi:large subunit ribosomal protein L10